MIVRFSFLVLIFYLKKTILITTWFLSESYIPVEKLITRERCDQEFNTLELNLYKSWSSIVINRWWFSRGVGGREDGGWKLVKGYLVGQIAVALPNFRQSKFPPGLVTTHHSNAIVVKPMLRILVRIKGTTIRDTIPPFLVSQICIPCLLSGASCRGH